MADREQTRRDAEIKRTTLMPVGEHECVTCTRCATTFAVVHPACPSCSQEFRLRAELEQAERERDGYFAESVDRGAELIEAEARLAKMPALVEALRYYAKTKDSRGAVARQALIEMGER